MYKAGHTIAQPRLQTTLKVTQAICINLLNLNIQTLSTNIPKRNRTLRSESRTILVELAIAATKNHEVCDSHGIEYPLHNATDNFTGLFVDCIRYVHGFHKHNVMYERNHAFTNVSLGLNNINVLVKCKLVTGSQINVIPISTYKQLGSRAISLISLVINCES